MPSISTHRGRVTHICVSELTIIGSDNGLSPGRRQAIVNWTLRDKLQWNFNRNSNIFIQENALENVVCEMASILSRPQCVKHKTENVTLNSHFPGSHELMSFIWYYLIQIYFSQSEAANNQYSYFGINSLRPSDAIWHNKSWSTLAQVWLIAWQHQAIT